MGGVGKKGAKKVPKEVTVSLIYFVHKSTAECFSLIGPFLTWVWTEITKICWGKYFFSLKTGKAGRGDGSVLTL